MEIIAILLLVFFISIFVLLLPIIALIDIMSSRFEGNDKLLMVLIVIFMPFGAILYFFLSPSRKIRN